MRLLIGLIPTVLVVLSLFMVSANADRRCSPAYPDICIPAPPPDLDCGDISARNFKVLAPDPHRFDGDRDGIGCEA